MADLARQDDGIAAQAKRFGAARVADRGNHQGFAHHGLGFPRLGTAAVVVHHTGHQFVVQAAPVHADAHRLVVAAGHFDHLREVVVATLAPAHVAGIDAVFGQGLRALGKLREQLVAVVVEVAHQRHRHAHAVELFADGGHLARGFGRVDGDAHHFGTGQGQCLDLHRRGDGIGRIGIGHGLHHHRRAAAHRDHAIAPADVDGACGAARGRPDGGRRVLTGQGRSVLHGKYRPSDGNSA